jgi:hypothetical protein
MIIFKYGGDMLKVVFVVMLFIVSNSFSGKSDSTKIVKRDMLWGQLQNIDLSIGYKLNDYFSSIIDTMCLNYSFGKYGKSSFALLCEWAINNRRKDTEYNLKVSHTIKSPKYIQKLFGGLLTLRDDVGKVRSLEAGTLDVYDDYLTTSLFAGSGIYFSGIKGIEGSSTIGAGKYFINQKGNYVSLETLLNSNNVGLLHTYTRGTYFILVSTGLGANDNGYIPGSSYISNNISGFIMIRHFILSAFYNNTTLTFKPLGPDISDAVPIKDRQTSIFATGISIGISLFRHSYLTR